MIPTFTVAYFPRPVAPTSIAAGLPEATMALASTVMTAGMATNSSSFPYFVFRRIKLVVS